MNKTVFFKTFRRLFGFVLAISLSASVLTAQAQNARITLNLSDVPMSQVMKEIEKQTRYLFINKGVDTGKKLSVNLTQKTIQEVLDYVLKNTDITYKIDGTYIILAEKAAEKPVAVTGKVSDVNGVPVIGASVVVKGTTVGTSTDMDGTFSLQVPPPAATAQLEVNFLGYEPVMVSVGNRTSFDVTLHEAASEIEGVVVTALGIKRQEKALSYNVQQVKAEDITTVKDANFINSLTGKVAGVTINASSSGVGGASKVILRGNKSISQSSNALYVIDGIPMYNFGGGGGTEFDSRGASESIADINPEDIESMSVLTGAAAAALYGSNAANGAIMITTKKGKAGALKVTLSSNTEFLDPFVQPEFQNRYGTGSNGVRSGSGIYSWGQKLLPAARYGYTPADFFDTGHVYTNAVTVSGGTDKNQTYFSAASVNSDGIIPNNEYDRYNFTFRNTSYFLKDKLRLDASASYIYQKDQNMTNQGVYSNPLVPAYLFPRGENFAIYKKFERYNPGTKLMEQFWSADMEGGDLRMQNPYWIAYRNLRNTDKKRYMLSFSASYDILPWLSVSGRVRLDNSNSLYTQKLYASSNTTITDGGKNGHYTEARAYDTQLSGDVKSLPAVPPGGKPPLKDKEYTSGWILSDTDILRRLDGAAGKEDSFLPVKLSGKGTLTQTASTLSAEDFQNLLTIVKRKLLEIYHHMEKGHIPIRPVRYKNQVPCTYCPFHAICRFDPKGEGESYDYINLPTDRELKKQLAERAMEKPQGPESSEGSKGEG